MQKIKQKFDYLKKVYPALKDTKLEFKSYPLINYDVCWGTYETYYNIVQINPDANEEEAEFTLYHESRHRIQHSLLRNYTDIMWKYSSRNMTYVLLERDANKFAQKMTGKTSEQAMKMFSDGHKRMVSKKVDIESGIEVTAKLDHRLFPSL